MKTMLAAMVALSGCALYDDGDDSADVDAGLAVDASAPSLAGEWSVGWTCEGQCPNAGYSAVTAVTITEQPGRVTIRWASDTMDVGQRGERDLCAAFPDTNWKSDFELCLVETDPPNRATATITWLPQSPGSSTWRADLSRM